MALQTDDTEVTLERNPKTVTMSAEHTSSIMR